MMSGHRTNPIFFNKKIRSGRSEHSLVDVICVSPLMSACVSEAVEKIPNNNQKDYRKQSLCVIVCIATTYQYHHFGYQDTSILTKISVFSFLITMFFFKINTLVELLK